MSLFPLQPMEHGLLSRCVPNQTHFALSRLNGNVDTKRIKVFAHNGSLLIQHFGWSDRGTYHCIPWNNLKDHRNVRNKSDTMVEYTTSRGEISDGHWEKVSLEIQDSGYGNTALDVALDLSYRERQYNMSLIYGLATAGGFLLITLLAKLIFFLLHK